MAVHCRGWDAEGNQDGENTNGIERGHNADAQHGLDLEQLKKLQSDSSASSDDEF